MSTRAMKKKWVLCPLIASGAPFGSGSSGTTTGNGYGGGTSYDDGDGIGCGHTHFDGEGSGLGLIHYLLIEAQE